MKHTGKQNQSQKWIRVIERYENRCPSLCKVLEFMLCVPNGTSELERIFKVLKSIKSKKRNSLSPEKLKKILKTRFFMDIETLDMKMLYKIFVSI